MRNRGVLIVESGYGTTGLLFLSLDALVEDFRNSTLRTSNVYMELELPFEYADRHSEQYQTLYWTIVNQVRRTPYPLISTVQCRKKT